MTELVAALWLGLFCAPVEVGNTGARYDADVHTLEARGAQAADLRAPSAAVARVKAERAARGQAEKQIAAALSELGDERSAAELNKTAAAATIKDERFGSDGSVELTLTLSTARLNLHRHRR
jgi:hypothetical protein